WPTWHRHGSSSTSPAADERARFASPLVASAVALLKDGSPLRVLSSPGAPALHGERPAPPAPVVRTARCLTCAGHGAMMGGQSHRAHGAMTSEKETRGWR